MRLQILAIALAVLLSPRELWSQDGSSLANLSEPPKAFPDSPLDWRENGTPAANDEAAALRQQLDQLMAQQRETQLALDRLRQQIGDDPPVQEPGIPSDPSAPPGIVVDAGQPAPSWVECPPEPTLIERLGTRYHNGFILVESPDPQRVPFQLTLNVFNQLRAINQNLDPTFTDHLGNVRPVDARNDINVNRNLYYFGGYVFDPKLIYNIIIWSSNSVATVIQGGYNRLSI